MTEGGITASGVAVASERQLAVGQVPRPQAGRRQILLRDFRGRRPEGLKESEPHVRYGSIACC